MIPVIPLGALLTISAPLAQAVGEKDKGEGETTTCDDGQGLPKNNVVEEFQGGDHVRYKARSFRLAMSLPRLGEAGMRTTKLI